MLCERDETVQGAPVPPFHHGPYPCHACQTCVGTVSRRLRSPAISNTSTQDGGHWDSAWSSSRQGLDGSRLGWAAQQVFLAQARSPEGRADPRGRGQPRQSVGSERPVRGLAVAGPSTMYLVPGAPYPGRQARPGPMAGGGRPCLSFTASGVAVTASQPWA